MGSNTKKNHVAVVVLGDIGRSPRMQYHSMSLSKLPNTHVTLIGYRESEPHPQILNNENITIESLRPFPISLSTSARKKAPLLMLLWPFIAIYKVLFQIFQLLSVLLTRVPTPLNTILVQSPPAIPTIFVMQMVCMIRGTRLVIDWHNLGYTLLQLSLNKPSSHPIIRIATFIERFFAKNAYAHLFVTKEMKNQLVRDWDLKGKTYVFHDKASPIFKHLNNKDQIEFLKIFIEKYKIYDQDKKFIENVIEKRRSNKKEKNTSIIISSTSWTPDEDFSILLDAIVKYDLEHVVKSKNNNADDLLFIITGKGPQKQMYEKKISELLLKKSRVITVWLDSEDYPKLLACCDMGISLHNSSSGIDLPMKVVDMFGCCLPVLAVDFKCIGELVKPNYNGFLFKNSEGLYHLLNKIFDHNRSDENDDNEDGDQMISRLRKNLIKDRENDTWDNNWLTIKHLFLPLSQQQSSSSSKNKNE
ncbi:hypothetical protein DICPUDRAFT_52859 [Dictyostelium purpureum]|uniref:Beta-1,4-mannosyltransferase n=1 Tax=Dictyostelium purpureum TaxID=5786 RepID=F0ZAA5_DICPU|nr:uncharacterized protein DICPUDRAFT_52859 [Dictyostelium purpureum]EGC39092.1 hypothetical protein DICPUDRAFT_52859 [Dictyostelium purpureum]|eukprot:XP_003284344.1 hypothetical protein DICPUDRAFT_52859 [Dictyostelium purpureum]